jgi:hypothetical protein
MNTPNDGGPAFPPAYAATLPRNFPQGMSLRDWFAGQALAGLCANRDYVDESYPSIAEYAYHHADAMLKARNKEVAQ